MSLVPTNYSIFGTVTNTASYFGSVTATVRLNYVSMVSSGTFGISMYFNQGSTALVNITGGNGSGVFSNAITGGVQSGQFSGQSTNNNTFYTTNNYSQELRGTINAYVNARDDNPFADGYPINAFATLNFSLRTVNITKMFTVSTSAGYYMFILPPASTCIGKLFFVKNYGNTGYCSVSTTSSSEVIDGYTLNQVQLTYGQCVGLTAISATQWSILTFVSNLNIPSIENIAGTPTDITSPVFVANITSANKICFLPSVSGIGDQGKMLLITAYNTTRASANFSLYFQATAGYLAGNNPNNPYIRLSIAPDLSGFYDHNVSVLLLSTGEGWHLVGYFTGSGCYFDNINNGLPGAGATTNGIVRHTWGGWATTHSLPVSSGDGRLYFVKMTNVASADYGVIIQNIATPGTYGYIGFPNGWGRVYKNSNGNVNYSGFAMLQANIGGNTVHFPLTMYPSLV